MHHAEVTLDENGNGTARMRNTYSGLSYNDMQALLLGDQKDKKKLLYKRIDIPDFTIVEFMHEAKKSRLPEIMETLDLKLDNYATLMNNRMLLRLNLLNRKEPLPYDRDKRKSDIEIRRAYLEIDTIHYTFPKNFEIENIPESQELNSEFGAYNFEVVAKNNQLIYIRTLKINKGQYDKTAYPEFFAYIEQIAQMDKAQAVLIRNE